MDKALTPQIGLGSVAVFSTEEKCCYEIENFFLPKVGLSVIVLDDSTAKEVLFNYLASYQGRRHAHWHVISRCESELQSPGAILVSRNPEAQFSECFTKLQLEFTLGLALRSRTIEHQEILSAFYLGALGLQDKVNENIAGLSSGQKQRLLIASALAVTNSLLLIDSGLGFIDAETRERLFPFFRQLCRALDISIIVGVTSTSGFDLSYFDSVFYAKRNGEIPAESALSAGDFAHSSHNSPIPVTVPSSETIIDCHQLSFRFPESSHILYNGFSFRLYPRQAIALVGSNGSGKSTLAKILTGFLEPSEGTVQVCGHIARSWFLRKTPMISVAFPDPDLTITQPSVASEIDRVERGSISEIAFQELFCMLRLNQCMTMNPFDLDWKMRRRLALAKAIRAARVAVFCDEPWIDEADNERGILRDIVELCVREGLSVLIATNDRDFAMAVSLNGVVTLPSPVNSTVQNATPSVIRRFIKSLTYKHWRQDSVSVDNEGNINREGLVAGWMSKTIEFSLFWERYIYPSLPSIISKMNLPPEIMILDLGCGTGLHLANLYGFLNRSGIKISGALGFDNERSLVSVGSEMFSRGGHIKYLCRDLTDDEVVDDIVRNDLRLSSNLLVLSLFSLHDFSSWRGIKKLLHTAQRSGGCALAIFVSPNWVESKMNLPKIPPNLHGGELRKRDWEWMAPFPVTEKDDLVVPYYHRTAEQYISLFSSFWPNVSRSVVHAVMANLTGGDPHVKVSGCRSDEIDFIIAVG